MLLSTLALALAFAVVGSAQNIGSYTIRPVVGSGSQGDGGPATSALLDGPYGLAQDAHGNVYISESNAGIIRKVSVNGIIERFAGSGILDDGLEGQPALQTDLISPGSLLVDSDGGLIFTDTGACRIRKVLTNGTVQDLVGTGRCSGSSVGFPGGGTISGTYPPLETTIGVVGGMIKDASGQLIFSDVSQNVVWRVDSDGIVRIIAGTGSPAFSGDTYSATAAGLNSPHGVTLDGDGNIYIADSGNCRVREIDISDGDIDTVAGNSTCTSVSSNWNNYSLGTLNGLAYDASTNTILISSPGIGRVVQMNVGSLGLSTVVGSGNPGVAASAPPLQYPLNQPADILISGSTVLVADNTSFRVLQVQGNAVTAFAGIWPQPATYGSASSAPMLRPSGLCSRQDGSLLVMDADAGRILSFSSPNQLAALAGEESPMGYSSGDGGPALMAQLNQPRRMACDSKGNVYATESNEIRLIDSQGTIQAEVTAVQVGDQVSSLNDPTGIAIDAAGRLVFSDASLNQVFRIDFTARTMTVIAGTGTAGFGGDGGAATSALLNSPGDLALDSKGNLYIADRANGAIRQVSPTGVIQTIAGAYFGFSYSNISGSPAISVSLSTIEGMTIDVNDQIYLTETSRLSVIKTDGNIYVVGGYQSQSNAGVVSYVNGPMYGCDGVTTDSKGRVYVSVDQVGQVMMVLPPGDPGPPPAIGSAQSASAFGAFTSVAPGSWVEIYGANLASTTRSWASSDFSGNQAPADLSGTTVAIEGHSAFVSYISPTQVNVQVPSGVSAGAQSITVTTAAGTSASHTTDVNSTEPGLFAPSVFQIGGMQYVGALFADGSTYVLPPNAVSGVTSRPANPGETIILYGVGFGNVTPGVNAGTIVQKANMLDLPLQILFNQIPATVTYAGLALDEVGLYQFNVVVPSGLQAGAVPITFTLGGTPGNQVLYTAVGN